MTDRHPHLDKYPVSGQIHGLEQKRMMPAESMNHQNIGDDETRGINKEFMHSLNSLIQQMFIKFLDYGGVYAGSWHNTGTLSDLAWGWEAQLLP